MSRLATLALSMTIGFLGSHSLARAELSSPAPPPASPYSLPWQLRAVIPASVLRLDSALAFYKDRNGNAGGFASTTVLTGSYKLIPELAIIGRFGMVNNIPPANASGASSFTNPLLGAMYSLSLPNQFRLGFFLGFTAPIGRGGGNSPDPAVQAANSAGILARSAMDNALFAVNYFTAIPGLDIAYIANGTTVQFEATILQLTRVRGEQIDKDPSRTNFTSGLTVGHAVHPDLSVLGELRYQKWLNNSTVSAALHPAEENLSFAIGPRFTLKTETVTLKPGISFAMGLAGPMASRDYTYPTNNYKVVFIDLPMVF